MTNPTNTYHRFNGKIMPVDHFQNVKGAYSIVNNARKDSALMKIFGCKECKWCETDLCPHKGEVTRQRPHANWICSQRLSVPMALHDDGIRMSNWQMMQVRGYMDAEFVSMHIIKEALEKKRDINDVYAWEKLKSDIIRDMRKQDEGSKLTVTRNSLDDLRRTISVNAEIKTIEGESDELRKQAKEEVKEIRSEDISDDIHATGNDLTDIVDEDSVVDVSEDEVDSNGG